MTQRIALVFGIVFILVGVLGFFTSGMDMTADPEAARKLLGLFAVNAVHNGVHIGYGIWGLLASRSWPGSKNFLTIGGAIYLLLAVVAFVSPDGFGLVPLGGHDTWLHGLLGIAMLLSGMTAKAPA
jgi:hypothetical protein